MPETPSTRPVLRAAGWAAVAVLLSLALGALPAYQGWDTSYYLAQTSSLSEDGDLDLRNDLLHVQRSPRTLYRQLTKVYPNGALVNNRPIGPSTLWLPAYAAARPLVAEGTAPERWGRAQLAALQLLSMALAVWLLWALDRWLRRMGVGRRLAALAALTLVVGSPLLIYAFRGFRGSHLASTVAVMWLLLAALRLGRRPTLGTALLCGVAVGLVFLCRWQDVVKAVVLVIPAVDLWRRGVGLGRGLKLAAAAATGAALVAGLQLHAWALARGDIFGLPQGSGYLRLAEPELARFLFSGLSGLLTWSPVFALGLLGLLLPWRCRLPASWRWIALGLLLFDIYFNASVADWWGGAAYGARRMCSDVPLLALGLGNLALTRRWRLPAAALLALFCLWGAVTSNLFTHGLRDLSLVFAGQPSDAPRAEREGGAQPSPEEARALARGVPFRLLLGNYFPGAGRGAGRLLTALVMAGAMSLVAWLLARGRPAKLLTATLVAGLAIVLFAHARLLASGRGDSEEQLEWRTLAFAARGEAAAVARVEPGVERLLAERGDGRSDARSLMWIFALRRQGRTAEAAGLMAGLEERGYLFVDRLRPLLALGPEDRMLLERTGTFFRVQERRSEHALVIDRKVNLSREALRLRLDLEIGELTSDPRLLFSWTRRGEASLTRVLALGPDRLRLETPVDSVEAALPWRGGESYAVELFWRPGARRVDLTVAAGLGEPVRLAAAMPEVRGSAGRIELTFGAPLQGGGHRPAWNTLYSDLRVSSGPEPTASG